MTINSQNTESFAALLDESLGKITKFEGNVVKGRVASIDRGFAIIDVGLKSEGSVSLDEFGPEMARSLKPGDIIDIYVERFENKDGEAVLSYEKARREASWENLEESHRKNERVMGRLTGRVKGGFAVDLSGALAFLPGSQIDVRPIKDISPLVGIEQPFQILKMDRLRGNIVVSRRAIMEESQAEARSELLSNLQEGQVVKGVVKNITDYGAFIDLGGIDGLLHVTDIAWQRINHPSDVLHVGQSLEVKIIKYNQEDRRISLGIKQLKEDPWAEVSARYKVGDTLEGAVTNITDYGVFVELDAGVEGLIHMTELSWVKKNIHPSKIVSTSERVKVKVLEIDPEKRRISLSIKQGTENPWEICQKKYKVGDIVEGVVKNVTEFGLFVGIEGDIDGMVHVSDISWSVTGEAALALYKKGDVVKAKLLDVDAEKERISLGIKQLDSDPFESGVDDLKPDMVLTCVVKSVLDNGVEVETEKGVLGFIRKSDLSRERSEQRTDRFAVGERVDAQLVSVDKKNRRLTLSIKARELSEEKEAMATYGSSDSGASLGDILGNAIDIEKVKAQAMKRKAKQEESEAEASKAEPKTKAKTEEKPAAKKPAAKKASKKDTE
jgi:small subunit ribosomal protein S1